MVSNQETVENAFCSGICSADITEDDVMKKHIGAQKIVCAIMIVVLILLSAPVIVYRNQIATLSSVKKIDDYPIYLMDYKGTYWFDDYMKTNGSDDDEDLIRFLENKLTYGLISNTGNIEERPNAMCTCFVCENENGEILYCRNLEESIYCPSVVVITHDGTYQTIGTSFLLEAPKNATFLTKNTTMLWEPYFTADGMNEAGLAISDLSVPYSPLPANDNAPCLTSDQICRLVLNEASTVDEAVMLFDTFKLNASMFETLSACHFLIADKSGNMAVVEIHDGKVDVVEPIHDNYMTVTNFYLNDDTSSGTGQARYNFVEDALAAKNGVMTVDEALDLLASVNDPFIHAEWSCVYNLTTGEMYIMPHAQRENTHEIEVPW